MNKDETEQIRKAFKAGWDAAHEALGKEQYANDYTWAVHANFYLLQPRNK